MTRFWRWAIAVAAMCVCAALTGWSWRWATRPAMLSLAVGPPGFDDAQLAEAFSRLLAADKSPVRLSIVHTGGPIEFITKLTRGEVQLAITRTDIKVGDLREQLPDSTAILWSFSRPPDPARWSLPT